MIGLAVLGILTLGIKWWYDFQKFKNDRTLHQLASMHRRDFEIYVSKALKRKGWKKVKVNKGSQDGGYDVSGFQN